jgi:shikimate dehydrogenase
VPFEWRDAPRARFAVIGDPIGHSLSPQMQNAALRDLGVDGEYVAIRVEPSEACVALDHLAGLGYEGVNVTVPNKGAVLPWLTSVEPFAARVGAVNTIKLATRTGTNTDGPGFLQTFTGLGVKFRAYVLMLGAGGSARAILTALASEDFDTWIWNRTKERAEALVEESRVGTRVVDTIDPSLYDLIINGTSSTLQEAAELPIDWSRAKHGAVAYDLSYPESKSLFLRGAKAVGLKTKDGLGLLVAQGALSLEWWLGVEPNREVMLEAVS